jgi:hypothetical protein
MNGSLSRRGSTIVARYEVTCYFSSEYLCPKVATGLSPGLNGAKMGRITDGFCAEGARNAPCDLARQQESNLADQVPFQG